MNLEKLVDIYNQCFFRRNEPIDTRAAQLEGMAAVVRALGSKFQDPWLVDKILGSVAENPNDVCKWIRQNPDAKNSLVNYLVGCGGTYTSIVTVENHEGNVVCHRCKKDIVVIPVERLLKSGSL